MRIMLFGTFDGLHPGHRFILQKAVERAASSGASLHIVVARDSNVERIKGRPPVQTQEERMASIQRECPYADVILGDEADFLAPVRTVQPDLLLLGYDQKLPPGIAEHDLPAPIERLPAFHPDLYKSSLLRPAN